jgi:hypothetical protein
MYQQRPYDPGILVGQADSGNIEVAPERQARKPSL